MSKRKPPQGGAPTVVITKTPVVATTSVSPVAAATGNPEVPTAAAATDTSVGISEAEQNSVVSASSDAGTADDLSTATSSPAPLIPAAEPSVPVLTADQQKDQLVCDRMGTLFADYASLMDTQKIVLPAEDQRRGALIFSQIVDAALENGTPAGFRYLRQLITDNQDGVLGERYALRGMQQLTPVARNRTTTCFTVIRQRATGGDMSKINWTVISGHLYPRNPERAATFKEWLLNRTGE